MTSPSHSEIAPGTRVAIVRHGEAASNVEDTVAGHNSCRGLTEHGRQQVGALANRLERSGELAEAAALYSSILVRAVQTAEILAPALGNLAVEQRCSLCERHVGEADGMTWRQYEEAYGRL
ncbi:MAG TPA: histidine phosphatase family protein, partial [Acidimicrobiales bacterium]|nr:histidine phosphatase family protein [Acidimicrobiales bacterium]